MISSWREGPRAFWWFSSALVGLTLSGLLGGIEPIGGDPDRMYRPIKAELARALAENRLPHWSDHLGLGFPLVAESHAAAFYPPNLLIYSVVSVSDGYRLSMFLHYLLMAGATFAYARRLGLTSAGAGLAAVSFCLCGFQSIHSSHEWSYHALAYLPLCLLLAEWFMAEGRLLAIVLLAIAFAAQLTVGHFQIQSWTAGLVGLTGLWRSIGTPRLFWRLPALAAGLAWGAAIAAPQLGASWELARFVGFDKRSFSDLAFFGFPLAHWNEAVIPTLFRGISGGPEAPYWYSQATTGYEACFYVGAIPLILGVLGLCVSGGRGLGLWGLVAPVAFLLSIMPTTWLWGYSWVVALPGMGLFRAPGRFLALSSLGLSLFAGRGLERTGRLGRAWLGLALSWAIAAVAAWWAVSWATRPDHQAVLGGDRLWMSLGLGGVTWLVASILIAGWLKGWIGPGVLLAVTAIELGALYYTSTTEWDWAIDVPGQSPILSRLAEETVAGRIAGPLNDLPVRFGRAPAFPYTGFAPPPPHLLLEPLNQRERALAPAGENLLHRFGVTHGVWDGPVDGDSAETLLLQPDPVLDRLVYRPPGAPPHPTWRLVRYKEPMPQVRAATRMRIAPDRESLIAGIAYNLDPSVVWYEAKDRPPTGGGPRADSARVVDWNGRTALVEHDGPCDLVINRTYYPGWVVSIDDGPERPVSRAELGVQAVHLEGAGTSRARFAYRPTNLRWTLWVAGAALLAALAGLGFELARRLSPKPDDSRPEDQDAGEHRPRGGVEPRAREVPGRSKQNDEGGRETEEADRSRWKERGDEQQDPGDAQVGPRDRPQGLG